MWNRERNGDPHGRTEENVLSTKAFVFKRKLPS